MFYKKKLKLMNTYFKRTYEFFGLIDERISNVKRFVVIFYFIGLIGMLIPITFNFFKLITPFALIVNFFILSAYHQNKLKKIHWFIIFLIFFLGLTVEIIGVNTGKIFGIYTYGNSLGIKIFKTPIIIGLNWLFLCYLSTSIVQSLKINFFLKVLFASSLMLIYDLVLEQIAPTTDMWYWKNNYAPFQNYLVWFILATIFNFSIFLSKFNTQNKLSTIIFASQFTFFLIIFLAKI